MSECKHVWELIFNPDNSFRRVVCKNCPEQMDDAEIEYRINERDALYEKAGKAFWEGHMRGRLYGQEAMSKESIVDCAKWLDALLTE